MKPPDTPLLRHQPAIYRALPYTNTARSLWQLRKNLSGVTFDVLLNLGMYLHALPPALLARSRRRLCLGPDYARDRLQWFHREAIPVPPHSRVVDVFYAAGAYLGLKEAAPTWSWVFPTEEVTARTAFYAGAGVRPRVVLLPCSGRAEKDWPAERWVDLANRLQESIGAFVVVTGGPGLAEQRTAARVATEVPDVRVAVGDDLRRVLWILSGCDLVVGPDTGPLHMARALGVPLVGLYGHTDPERYAPPPPFPGEIIDRYRFDAPGRHSVWTGTGGRSDRMQLISVAEVEEACRRILKDPATAPGTRREAVA